MKRGNALLAFMAAPAVWSPPVIAAGQASEAAADEIVKAAVPPERFIDVLALAYGKSFDDTLVAQLVPLEQRHAGLTAQVRADAVAELRSALNAETPGLMTALRSIYLRSLSPAEIVALRDFYRTAAGHRMAQAALAGASDQTLRDVGRADPASVPGRAYAAAVGGAIDTISGDELPVLRAFARTSVAAKLPTLQPLQQQAVQQWNASIEAGIRARLQAAITGSIRRFVTAHPVPRSRVR